MHPLDFISDSPNLFILHKESNKTNFGGFIFLLYIITIIGIIIYYCINYSKDNNKFTVQSLMHFNLKTDEEIEARNKDEKFNQNISFLFNLTHNNINLGDKFKILDNNNKSESINRGSDFNSRTNEFDIQIYYECEKENCSDFYENFIEGKDENNKYKLELLYNGFTLEHQNEDQPIQKNAIFIQRYNLQFNKSYLINNIWENIFYSEKFWNGKGINQSCGYIDHFYKYEYDLEQNEKKIFLAQITINNNYLKYIEYKRVKFSKIDLLANLLSLFSNLFLGARIFIKFYSKKFNNYKIIENILAEKLRVNINRIDQIVDGKNLKQKLK